MLQIVLSVVLVVAVVVVRVESGQQFAPPGPAPAVPVAAAADAVVVHQTKATRTFVRRLPWN